MRITERFRAGVFLPVVLLLLLYSASFLPAAATSDEVIPAEVYVIPLREDVDRYLGVFLGRSLETAKKAEAELIIIEIDTFGGRVDTALEIASKIGAASWARTVAYVPADNGGRGVSWSAGALMAFSASEIWMTPGTSMGAAAPVYQTAEGMEAAGEKTVSAVRGQIAALAEKNGYPVAVALAMVDMDVVLKEVYVNGVVSLATAADIEEMERKGEEFELGKTVCDSGKLLTLTAGEMEKYGVSSGTVSTREELIASFGFTLEDTVVLEKSRADSLITFLTSGAVTSILILAGLVALYLEITSPGFGIPGTIALVCFAVVFGISGLIGNLGPAEILM
ncbi:MAG: nodulation protein NfeD, partial [Spirochaetaceae bacterium]|nr:nodulation protein NfeD [Spirochaetaceae bacterium]